MSEEHLQVVRRFYELWNARDFDAMAPLLAPHAVVYTPDGWPEPGPFHGRDAIMREVRTVQEDFGVLTILLEQIAAREDWVLTRHHTHGRGDRSGLEAEFRNSVAFRLRAGKIIEARFYWDHADALRALGLAG
jgi:ketosteroid isomerase-like protein